MTSWEFVYTWVLCSALFIASSFAWVIIHEFSHLIAAKLTCGVSKWEMKVWPCKLNGVSVGGYVKYSPITFLS